jgi:hypothetical protein
MALTSSPPPRSPSPAPSSPYSARLLIAQARASDNKPLLWRSSPTSISSAPLVRKRRSTMTAKQLVSPRLPPRPLARAPAGDQACSRRLPCGASSTPGPVWPCRVAGRQLQARPTGISPTRQSRPQGCCATNLSPSPLRQIVVVFLLRIGQLGFARFDSRGESFPVGDQGVTLALETFTFTHHLLPRQSQLHGEMTHSLRLLERANLVRWLCFELVLEPFFLDP